MTTKSLLRNDVRELGTFSLHLDARFKLNNIGYPVLECGITDTSRAFHLVALTFLVMDKAQHKAITTVFADRLLKYDRSRAARTRNSTLVYKGKYDLHFARREGDFAERKDAMLKEWARYVALTTFMTYVKSQ
ncbi:Hypothetical protein PHPALM_11453 [Phytophthora palmivora]|uniref:Uncharacterized protein n=1 Tax=Phytophthora palmivora TaxID=4796 RepID=A0A2P4Y274_9STRA|nr:Hypothetical protein PHPALM_11453 [Phytophthora palmivora]